MSSRTEANEKAIQELIEEGRTLEVSQYIIDNMSSSLDGKMLIKFALDHALYVGGSLSND